VFPQRERKGGEGGRERERERREREEREREERQREEREREEREIARACMGRERERVRSAQPPTTHNLFFLKKNHHTQPCFSPHHTQHFFLKNSTGAAPA